MDSVKINNGKKNFLAQTWKRCRSRNTSDGINGCCEETMKQKTTPEGYIPVYVGPEKQRFAVKTKYVNHPLFTMLLEDAETEYGYNCNGPIMLPCDVDLFFKVLSEMEVQVQPIGWSFAYGSCSPFNPSRLLGINGAHHGSYVPLTHTRLIKMN